MKYLKTLVIAFVVLLGINIASNAQVIVPVGETLNKSSQLVAWYTNSSNPNDTYVQVTNVSNSDVTLHIQIWASDDGSGDVVTDPCIEVNFTDTLTPNDTHTYEMDSIVSNTNACNATSCGSSNEIVDVDGTSFDHGFVTVTPVVSATDRRAIAFNNLIGSVAYDDDEVSGLVNTMGRLAVSFLDGSSLPDGTILDGITAGYVLIQPDVLKFNFSNLTQESEVVEEARIMNIIFSDNYSGPFGDYRSQPADAEFFTLLFDDAEVPTSCQPFLVNCMIDQGINEQIDAENTSPDPDLLICPGNFLDTGWARLAVAGLDGLENAVGFIFLLTEDDSTFGYARWMVAEGDVVVPTPAPTPTPTVSTTPTPTPDGSPSPTGGGQPGGGGGGGSGCAIAGPASAGTAVASALIVLLPAVVFGLRRKLRKA